MQSVHVPPVRIQISWDDFVERFDAHTFTCSTKLELPLFSPAVFRGDNKKEDNLVESLSMFVLDLDDFTTAAIDRVLDSAQQMGLAALFYTTWRHQLAPGKWRARLVVPLSRPVYPLEWRRFWPAAVALFGAQVDSSCANPARMYFAAGAPAGTEDQHLMFPLEGDHLPVEMVLGLAETMPQEELPIDVLRDPPEPFDVEQLKLFVKRLKRRSDSFDTQLGYKLQKVLDGEVFAQFGLRDKTIFRLSCSLAEQFPNADPHGLAGVFAPSLQLMRQLNPDDYFTVEDVAAKIQRAQDRIWESKQSVVQDVQQTRIGRIQEAFGSERSHGYTEDELQSFGPNIAKRWVIQSGRSYYLFLDGSYAGPYFKEDTYNAAIRALAPAQAAGVELKAYALDRLVPKGLYQLVEEYGTVADQVAVDLHSQRAYYDEETKTLVEAPCPLRDLEPRHDPEIDEWLALLAPSDKTLHKLKSWWAAATMLDQPCVALFITGPKGAGKSLTAVGLARLWTQERPTDLEELFGNFNEAILKCPLAWADEDLPRDWRGRVRNDMLRHHIQATARPLSRKFLPAATVRGAVRIIVSANNEDVLATNENLSSDDIDAIAERYLHVRARSRATDFLNKTDTRRWVRGDLMARHALWLRDHYDWEPEGRFLIRSEDKMLHRGLITRGGIRSAVCQWLVGYLSQRRVVERDPSVHRFVECFRGQLVVNAQALVSGWEIFVKVPEQPPIGAITQALRALSTSGRGGVKRLRRGRSRARYTVIDQDNLIAWADQNGVCSAEDIVRWIQEGSMDRVQRDEDD